MKFGKTFLTLALVATTAVEGVALPSSGPSGSEAVARAAEPQFRYKRAESSDPSKITRRKINKNASKAQNLRKEPMKPALEVNGKEDDEASMDSQKEQLLYFVGNQAKGQRFAKAKVTVKEDYTSVKLMNPKFVDYIECTPEHMLIKFKTERAFNRAAKWPTNKKLVLYSFKGCGTLGSTDDDGDNQYTTPIASFTLDPKQRTVKAVYENEKLENVIESAVVSWGEVTHVQGKTFETFNSTSQTLEAAPKNGTTDLPDQKPDGQYYEGPGIRTFFAKEVYNPKTGKKEKGLGNSGDLAGSTPAATRRSIYRRQDENAQTQDTTQQTQDTTQQTQDTSTEAAAPVREAFSGKTAVINDPTFQFGVGVGLLRNDAGDVSLDQAQCPFTKAAEIDEHILDGTDPVAGTGFYNMFTADGQNEVEATLTPDLDESKLDTTISSRRKARALRRAIVARDLHKRWSVWGVIKAACDFVLDTPANFAGKIYDEAIKVVQGKWADAMDRLEDAGRQIWNGHHEFNLVNTKLDFDFPSDKTLEAYKFKKADAAALQRYDGTTGFLITEIDAKKGDNHLKGKIYCIDCGVKGHMRIDGQVKFSAANGIEEAFLDMDGKMDLGMELGMEADGAFEQELEADLFQVRLGSGIYIPGIIDFKPVLQSAAWINLKIEGNAQLSAGVHMSWEAPKAKVDLLHMSATQSGWQPKIEKVFDYDMNVNAWLGAEFPVTLGMSIDILSGTWKHEVGLVEKPQLKLWAGNSAAVTVDGDLQSGFNNPEDTKCPGMAVNLQFENELYFTGLPKVGDEAAIAAGTAKPGQLSIWHAPKQSLYKGCFDARRYEAPVDMTKLVEGAPISQIEANAWAETKLETITERRKRGLKRGIKEADLSKRATLDAAVNPPRGMFENTYVASVVDGTYLATTSKGLVYLESARENRKCGNPANFIEDEESGAVVGDVLNGYRLMHAYTNELKEFGVSRLRIHEATKIPNTAEIMFLKANEYGDLYGLIPGDPKFVPYFLIGCEIKDQPTKIFVSQLQTAADGSIDTKSTFAKLMRPANQDKLTGGEVTRCSIKSFRKVTAERMAAGFENIGDELPEIKINDNNAIIMEDRDGVDWPTNLDEANIVWAKEVDADGKEVPNSTPAKVQIDPAKLEAVKNVVQGYDQGDGPADDEEETAAALAEKARLEEEARKAEEARLAEEARVKAEQEAAAAAAAAAA